MPYIGNPSAQRFTSPRAASVFSGDGSTVAFTLEEAVSTDEDILVSVDGVIQEPSVAYAVSNGTTLTFTAAPSSNSGNNIFVYYIARTLGSVSMPDGQNVNAATGSFSGAFAAAGGAVFNEGSADVDFRVESNGNANMLFIDGGNDQVGIGTNATNSYYAKNLVVSSSDEGGMTIVAENTGHQNYIMFADGTSGAERYRGYIGYEHNGDIMQMTSGGSSKFIVNDSAIAMNIDSTGAITKPLQPAFWVRPSSTQSNIAADGSTVTIVWGTETYDQNADFSSNTFTAPVTGKYFMHARVTLQSIDSAASYYQFNIVTSNAAHSFIFDPRGMDQDTNHYPFELTAVADMDVNDTATVTILQPNGTAQTDILHTSSWTSWYGYLLG